MQRKPLALLVLSSFTLASAAAVATIPPPPNAIWRGGFELFPVGNVPAGPTVVPSTAANCPNGVDGWRRFLTIRPEQLQIVSSPVAEGSKALQAQVQYNDVFPGMSESRTLMDPCEPQSKFYAGDADKWYRWQVQLPADYRSDFPKWDQLGSSDATTTARKPGAYNVEWHHAGSNGSSPIYMKTKNGSFTLCNNPDPFTACSDVGREWLILPLQTNIWIDWLVDYHPSAGSDGFMDIWADTGSGLQLLHANTAQVTGCTHTYCGPTAYGDPTFFDNPNDKFHYWEVGLYRDGHVGDPAQRYTSGALVYPDSPTPTTVFFDGWAIGNTRDSVYNAPLGGGAPPAAVSTLTDSFGAAAVDTSKWSVTQSLGQVAEGGGFLKVAPAANTPNSQAYVQSVGSFDLTGSSAYVKVPQVVASDGTAENNFSLVQDPQHAVAWWYKAGSLSATFTAGGPTTTLGSLPYSATTHAWWRIRESAGMVLWDTSADGSTWTNQFSVATSSVPFVNSIHPTLYAETFSTGSAAPGEAHYANFNVASVACATNPSVATLSDTFGGTSIDTTKWAAPTQTQGTVTESGGFLHEAPTANAAAAGLLLQSNGTYDLRSSMAYVKVPQVVANGTVDTNFTLLYDSQNFVSWIFTGTSLKARKMVGNVETYLTTLTYDPAVHVFWRIRETAGSVFWETSADGSSWTIQANDLTDNLTFVCGVKPTFFTETWAAMASPGEARFANFNVASSGGLPAVSSLSDSFGGTSIDLTKWGAPSQTEGTVTESGGFLHETPNANATSASLSLISSASYGLNGSAAYVKAAQVLGNGNQDMNFTMLQDANHLVSWLYSNGSLKARFANNAAPVVVGTALTYDPAVHVWWRIRESGGSLFWETSPDGLNWTAQATAATPAWLATGIKPTFFVESSGVASPGEARFASFNVGP